MNPATRLGQEDDRGWVVNPREGPIVYGAHQLSLSVRFRHAVARKDRTTCTMTIAGPPLARHTNYAMNNYRRNKLLEMPVSLISTRSPLQIECRIRSTPNYAEQRREQD